MRYLPGTNILVTAGRDATLRFWDAEGVRQLAVGLGHKMLITGTGLAQTCTGITAMTITDDGTTLLTGDGSGTILVWDLAELR